MKTPFSVQRIRKAAKKSPGNHQRTKKESAETNNRLTVQTWRMSERAGVIDYDVTYKRRCNDKKDSVTKHSRGALARSAPSGAPRVKKCGKLPIRENLVIT